MPKCKACGSHISFGAEIVVKDDFFHPSCFKCVFCNDIPFDDGAYIESGKLYCHVCWDILYRPVNLIVNASEPEQENKSP